MATTQTEQYSHRKVWTREDAAKLSDMFPGQRYELIEGDLINKMGQKPPHAYVIAVLTSILSLAFPHRVRIQSPIVLPEPEGVWSEPEPDVVLLRKDCSEFFHYHPNPQEITLLIEVSDTTFQIDRETKARLYSRCAIELYWIVDIQLRRILIFGTPGVEEYKSVTIYERHEYVTLPDGPRFLVDTLFGNLQTGEDAQRHDS
jgi:Uma2 family endonuclease